MKRILSILIIMILIFSGTQTYAKQNINITFKQPETHSISKGEKLDYFLIVDLPDKYENLYKSFAVTVLFDEDLSVEDIKLDGVEEQKGKVDVKKTTVKKNTQNLVTLTVNDMQALNGQRQLKVQIDTLVKRTVKDKTLNNSFVITSVDLDGDEHANQKNVDTKVKVEGKINVDDIFSDSRLISGTTEKNSKIKVFIDDKLIAKGTSDKNGKFSVKIDPQKEDTKINIISYFTKDEEDQTVSSIVSVKKAKETSDSTPVNDNTNSIVETLSDYIGMAQSLNIDKANREDEARFKAALANAEYMEIKTNLLDDELTSALRELKEAIKKVRTPYMNGYSKTSFGPSNNMKRSEVASVLTKIYLGKEANGMYSSFKDVKQESWYADAVGFMEKKGIISGYSDGSFKPEKSITRAEFATIITKYLKLEEGEKSIDFEDVSNDFWAKKSIDAVTSKGLMRGRTSNTFVPDEPITRAEVATVLNKMLNRVPNKKFMEKYSKNPFKDLNKNFWAYYEILEATAN